MLCFAAPLIVICVQRNSGLRAATQHVQGHCRQGSTNTHCCHPHNQRAQEGESACCHGVGRDTLPDRNMDPESNPNSDPEIEPVSPDPDANDDVDPTPTLP